MNFVHLKNILFSVFKPLGNHQKEIARVKKWLDKYEVKNYTIHDDFTVDVAGNVDLSYKKLKSIDVQFNIVKGNFYCYQNRLKSLKGSPQEVSEDFNCQNNDLISLQGGPKIVRGHFDCSENKLTSLNASPNQVGQGFYCDQNSLTSLSGCPEFVGGNFYCDKNQIVDLKNGPVKVGGDFKAADNPIKTLLGFKTRYGNLLSINSQIENCDQLLNFYLGQSLLIKQSDLNAALLKNELETKIDKKDKSISVKRKI